MEEFGPKAELPVRFRYFEVEKVVFRHGNALVKVLHNKVSLMIKSQSISCIAVTSMYTYTAVGSA